MHTMRTMHAMQRTYTKDVTRRVANTGNPRSKYREYSRVKNTSKSAEGDHASKASGVGDPPSTTGFRRMYGGLGVWPGLNTGDVLQCDATP